MLLQQKSSFSQSWWKSESKCKDWNWQASIMYLSLLIYILANGIHNGLTHPFLFSTQYVSFIVHWTVNVYRSDMGGVVSICRKSDVILWNIGMNVTVNEECQTMWVLFWQNESHWDIPEGHTSYLSKMNRDMLDVASTLLKIKVHYWQWWFQNIHWNFPLDKRFFIIEKGCSVIKMPFLLIKWFLRDCWLKGSLGNQKWLFYGITEKKKNFLKP